MLSGYLHPDYSDSLGELGIPRRLENCGGSLILRPVQDTEYWDAMGPYPLFACSNWSMLNADLSTLADEIVSLVLVADPWGEFNQNLLLDTFPDLMTQFKQHYFVDLSKKWKDRISKHHQRNIKLSCKKRNSIEMVDTPMEYSSEVITLYDQLIDRHHIRGIQKYSPQILEKQLSIPGVRLTIARIDNQIAGIVVWMQHDSVLYYHLGAYNDLGYENRSSYAIFWETFDHLSNHTDIQFIHLGAGAGVKDDRNDGLARFKRGWSPLTKTAYLCGRIFHPEIYEKLTIEKRMTAAEYFPKYRSPV